MNYLDLCPGEPDEEYHGSLLFGKIVCDIPLFLLSCEEENVWFVVRFATESEVRKKQYDFRTEQGFLFVYYERDGMIALRSEQGAREVIDDIERNPHLFSGGIGWTDS